MPRTTRTSQRAAEYAASAARLRIQRELVTNDFGPKFLERLKYQIARGFKPCVGRLPSLWNKPNLLDACDRDYSDWRFAIVYDRVCHNHRHLSAFCDSLVRVPPTYDVTCIPYPNEAPHVHEAFKRAQTQIERNRALTQVAAFSHAVMDGDGAIRARVAGYLI